MQLVIKKLVYYQIDLCMIINIYTYNLISFKWWWKLISLIQYFQIKLRNLFDRKLGLTKGIIRNRIQLVKKRIKFSIIFGSILNSY